MLPIIRRQAARQSAFSARTTISSPLLHQTVTRRYASKDSQDKDSIVTEPTEYSKSGSDSGAATEEAAFSADKTRPEEQISAEKNESQQSLNASPANSHLGTPASNKDDSGASPSESKSSEGSRARSSGAGSPNKQGSGPGKSV